MLTHLNPELLVEVFSHLTPGDLGHVAQVCKQFKDLAYSKRLWKAVEFKLKLRQGLDREVLPSLVRRGLRCISVCISDKDHLQEVLQAFPDVVSLNLNFMWMDHPFNVPEVLKTTSFVTLTRLVLTSGKPQFLEGSTMEDFLSQFPNLETLSWVFREHWRDRYEDQEVRFMICEGPKLLQGLRKLRTLSLMCGRIVSYHPISGYDFRSDSLENLCLWYYNFNGILLRTIGCAFPKLRRLELCYGKYVGLNLQEDCFRYLGHLQELKFSYCDNVTPRTCDPDQEWQISRHRCHREAGKRRCPCTRRTSWVSIRENLDVKGYKIVHDQGQFPFVAKC